MERKIRLLKAMNEIMVCANDEEICMNWITNGVPDTPSKEDFESIAGNKEQYVYVANLFCELLDIYGEEGIF